MMIATITVLEFAYENANANTNTNITAIMTAIVKYVIVCILLIPAITSLKFAAFKLALRKSQPRISLSEKSQPSQSIPRKDRLRRSVGRG